MAPSSATSSGGRRAPTNGKNRLIKPRLPFDYGRSDLLSRGGGSRIDIENINLLATLLAHSEYQGYWASLGEQFEQDILSARPAHAVRPGHCAVGAVGDRSGRATGSSSTPCRSSSATSSRNPPA